MFEIEEGGGERGGGAEHRGDLFTSALFFYVKFWAPDSQFFPIC